MRSWLPALGLLLASALWRVHAEKRNATCKSRADVLFVLDGSESVKLPNFSKMKKFVMNLTSSYDIGPSNVQVGALLFSSRVDFALRFDDAQNNSEVSSAISELPYLREGIQTAKALKYAREICFQADSGARPDATKIAVVVTDGESADPLETANEAMRLKASNVTTLAIGVGPDVNDTELVAIATSQNMVFKVANFDVLDAVLIDVLDKTCPTPDHGHQCTSECQSNYVCISGICQCMSDQIFDEENAQCINRTLVSFTSNPRIVVPSITETLNMKCSLNANMLDYVEYVNSIKVFREQEEVASITLNGTAEGLDNEDGHVVVTGNIDDQGSNTYLNLVWKYPGLEETGMFWCYIDAVNTSNKSEVSRAGVLVKSENPTIEQLAKVNRKNSKLIQTNTENNAKLEKDNEKCKDEHRKNSELLQSITEKYARLQEDSEQCKDAYRKNSELIESITENNTKLQMDNDKLREDNRKNAQLIQSISQKNAKIETDNGKLNEANRKNAQIIQRNAESSTRLQGDIYSVKQEISQIRNRNSELQRKDGMLQSDIARIRDDNRRLENKIRKPQHIESGTGKSSQFRSNRWKSIGTNRHGSTIYGDSVYISFGQRYDSTPNVNVALLEVDHGEGRNGRFGVEVTSVSTSGFYARCYTWDNSITHSIAFSWISYGN